MISAGMVPVMAPQMEVPREDMIPMKIMSEVPLPIPYSVIRSASHITREDPPTRMMTMNIIVNTISV